MTTNLSFCGCGMPHSATAGGLMTPRGSTGLVTTDAVRDPAADTDKNNYNLLITMA